MSAKIIQLRPQAANDRERAVAEFQAFLSRSKLSRHTKLAYDCQARNYVKWLDSPDGAEHADAFGDKIGAEYAVTAWKRWRLEQRHAVRSIRQAISAVILMYDVVFRLKVEVRQLRPPKKVAPDSLSAAEVLRLKKAADREAERNWIGVRDAAMIFLMLETGGRLEEISKLRERDIAITRLTGEVRYIGKGDQVRSVPISSSACRERLANYLRVRVTKAGPDEQALWINQLGKPLLYTGIDYLISVKYAEKARIPGLTSHKLRHTMATTCQRKGMNPVMLQEALGHTDPKSTATYTLPTKAELAAAFTSVFDEESGLAS